MPVVLLVHSHGVYRAALKLLLTYELGMRVVEVADSRTALLHLRQEQIDILVLDATADTDALQLIAHTHKYHPDLPVLLMAANGNRHVPKAQRMGAQVIGADYRKEDFISWVKQVL